MERFFITAPPFGLMGLAPIDAEVGDAIVVLAGGRAPFILRTVENTDEGKIYWRLIGDSYVHGIMDGEMTFSSEMETFVLV